MVTFVKLWRTRKGIFLSFDEANKKKNLGQTEDRWGPMGLETPEQINALCVVDETGETRYFDLGSEIPIGRGYSYR
jgi:hypothetical protein